MSGETRQIYAPSRGKAIDRVGGSLVNLILGALILWVGQTTFRHAGQLASIDERFDGVGYQLKAIDDRHGNLRLRLEQVVAQTQERTRSRFTREDADKMILHIKDIDAQHAALERQMLDRITSAQMKIIALETRDTSSHEVATLRAEVERLRAYIAYQPNSRLASYPNSISSSADGGPVHLPPTTLR